MNEDPKFRRVLIKVSGEALMGDAAMVSIRSRQGALPKISQKPWHWESGYPW